MLIILVSLFRHSSRYSQMTWLNKPQVRISFNYNIVTILYTYMHVYIKLNTLFLDESCRVKFGTISMRPASFASYFISFSVLLQAITFICISKHLIIHCT
jgi:hypothetical protein